MILGRMLDVCIDQSVNMHWALFCVRCVLFVLRVPKNSPFTWTVAAGCSMTPHRNPLIDFRLGQVEFKAIANNKQVRIDTPLGGVCS